MEMAFTKAWSGPRNGNGVYKGMETEKKHFGWHTTQNESMGVESQAKAK